MKNNSQDPISSSWISSYVFCFSNVLVTFYRYVNKILVKKLDIFVIIYLDDILIYIEDLGLSHVKVIY